MYRKIKLALLVSSAALLTACAAPQAGWTPLPFDEAEYSSLQKSGAGTLKGQVFAKTRGGDVKKGAGNGVYLMLATSYGTQRYTEEFVKGKSATNKSDPRHDASIIQKTTDGEGRFEFSNVPPGKYYVFSSVTWEVPSTNQFMAGMMEKQGGNIIKPVDISNGVVTDVVLTR